MTTETAAKRNTQKLQRAIVDGLEDVKAQDIQVFDTEHLSSLFERVIVASGTSNRQTKALAASVRDAVREAGFPKPRIEGEANGEWIIVDCSQAVVHIMQPTFRSYYHLEELWGEKPVRLKFGTSKPVTTPTARKAASTAAPAKTAAKTAAKTPGRTAAAGKPAGTRGAAAGRHAAKPVASRAAAPAAAKPMAKAESRPKAKVRTKVEIVAVSRPANKAPAAAKRGAVAPAKSAVRKAPARKTPARTR